MRRQVLLFVLVICSAPGFAQAWRNFNTSNSGLLSNSLSSIAFNENVLWAAYAGAGGSGLGIVKYENNTWTNYNTTNSGLPNNDVRAMASDHLGNMWFGCYQAGLVKFDGTTWTLYNMANSGLPHDGVSAITVDNDNNIWIGMYFGGVSKFDGTTWTTFNSSNAPFPSSNCINDIIVDQDFNLWVGLGCSGGLAKRGANGVWTSYTTSNSDIAHHTVSALTTDPNGSLWIGYITNVISNLQGSTWTHHALPAGASTSYHGFSVDHTGTIWCGTMGEGLLYYTGSAWLKVNVTGSGNTNSLFSQSTGIDQDNRVWWGEMYQGLWKSELQTDVIIPDPNFRAYLREMYPWALTIDDRLIIAQAPAIPVISCYSRGILDFTGLEYMTGLTELIIADNPTPLIPNLSQLANLQTFECRYSGITSLPDFTWNTQLATVRAFGNELTAFPDFTHNPKLRYIDVQDNNITTVPDLSFLPDLETLQVSYNPITTLPSLSSNTKLKNLWMRQLQITAVPSLSALTLLETVDLSDNNLLEFPAINSIHLGSVYAFNNRLTALPDFSATPLGNAGTQLMITSNMLTFEDLLPFVNKNFDVLMMAVQKKSTLDSDTSAIASQKFILKLPFDDAVTGSVYNWYKDDVLIATTSVNQFVIENADVTDNGVYFATITNPAIPDLTLTTGNTSLVVLEGVSWIADNNLRTCMKESYPSIFNARGYVITALAPNVDTIQCIGRGIKDLEGIQVFANLTSVSFGSNALTEIHEVSSLTKLAMLDIPNNEIASLPDFSTMPDLSILNLSANKILTFPDLTACSEMMWINVQANKLTSVTDLSSFTELTHLALGSNPLVTLPSLSQNTKLTYLDIQGTELTTFPDLSANLLLEHLYFGENPQFSQWPSITTNVKLQYIACDSNGMAIIPDLSIYPSLTYLSCAHNKLTQLPDLSTFQKLNTLVADHNGLTSLPDLQATQIGVDVNSMLRISNNHLSFEDLLPVVPGKIFALLDYQDQTLPVENIVANKKTGETFSLDINVDHAITGNAYRWVKDDTTFVMTTNNDNLTVQNLNQTDAGIYRCEITNASMPLLTLIWKQATLTICSDVTWDGFDVLVTSASCISGGKILVTKNGEPANFVNEFILEDIGSGTLTTSTIPEIVELPIARYNLSMNIEGCGLDWPETIEIVKDQSCESPVISPNNDGTAEDFYIPYQGLAKIYNREGQVVNEIAVPSAWSGMDGSGNPLPMGVYVIVVDGHQDITITVIR